MAGNEFPHDGVGLHRKFGASTNDTIRDHFEQALEAAQRQGDDGYLINDLRALNVVFA